MANRDQIDFCSGKETVYAGLAGIELSDDAIEIDENLSISKTIAVNIEVPLIIDFKHLDSEKNELGTPFHKFQFHGYQIKAELMIKNPSNVKSIGSTMRSLRVLVHPAISCPVISDMSFSSQFEFRNIDQKKPIFAPLDIMPRHIVFTSPDGNSLATKDFDDFSRFHHTCIKLCSNNCDFELALDILDQVRFVHNRNLALVSLWAALEALFSPGHAELSFRIPAAISAFLLPPGEKRLILFNHIKQLYNHRSSAAHGSEPKDTFALLKTIELMRRIVFKMVDIEHVPSKADFFSNLFDNKIRHDSFDHMKNYFESFINT